MYVCVCMCDVIVPCHNGFARCDKLLLFLHTRASLQQAAASPSNVRQYVLDHPFTAFTSFVVSLFSSLPHLLFPLLFPVFI